MFNIYKEAVNAENKIRSYVRETPLDDSISLSKKTKSNVYLKCENLQYTGSFKVRGAFNKLLSLNSGKNKRGTEKTTSRRY